MPPTRKQNKDKTRARLLHGTLSVLHDGGANALTTGRIAESAGVAQPTFYVHFGSVEEALGHAATAVCERWLAAAHAARAEIDRGAGLREGTAQIVSSYVDPWMAEPRCASLFLRHRRDTTSPLGRTFGELVDTLRRHLVADVLSLGALDAAALERRADLLVGIVLGAVEARLDGRATASEANAEAAHLLYLAVSEAALDASPAAARS